MTAQEIADRLLAHPANPQRWGMRNKARIYAAGAMAALGSPTNRRQFLGAAVAAGSLTAIAAVPDEPMITRDRVGKLERLCQRSNVELVDVLRLVPEQVRSKVEAHR